MAHETRKAHMELAKEYRAGKHNFKHPKNATKFAEMHERSAKSKALSNKKTRKAAELKSRSKKAGFYVHGHKNLGDVYEA